MPRKISFARIVAVSASIGVAALAGVDAPGRDPGPRTIGDWTLTASKDGKGCFLTREYPSNGGTTLLLGVDTDGTNRLSVLNAHWSIRPKDRLKLNFRLSNSAYPAHFAIGIASDGEPGFVTSFGAKFPSLFARSRTLSITRGDVPVARFDLDGAGVAVKHLGECVDDRRDAPSAATDDRSPSDDSPNDPFAAKPPRSKSKK